MAAIQQSNVIGMYDAKTHFAEILGRATEGEEFTITKHGTPVAKLGPVKRKKTAEERRAAIARWLENSRHITLGGLKIKDLIAEGRR
jgi:prevent-host-death family protein